MSARCPNDPGLAAALASVAAMRAHLHALAARGRAAALRTGHRIGKDLAMRYIAELYRQCLYPVRVLEPKHDGDA